MHPIHAQLLGLTPLKLKAQYDTHTASNDANSVSVPLALPVRLAEDIALALNCESLEVISGESIALHGTTLTLPNEHLTATQKQQLWQVIYHAVST
ncbi:MULTISPECIES: hypothetical protein [Pseudoalteromonas]|uniref:Uncharacterized protein n=1 Tax=Pseudoalteromonas luteoviolacea (strain 2ta16) TaxID=1353533 RepID=V4HLH6_PSEL2|nr:MULTISPECIES: hypothetical protein [Pseudoalteromonas]ESP91690.1 hypothetical protein PL2TA16_05330 [Pseudoalteromonas luteoviolacea 2ta16]KZN40830.1 hypothetical protein N483_17025 [Pseudoalteromonas luteoviolacea NCIMB 1944]MCG7546705.1 hypothetical protein [Pseudoalteromonas sp. Of7M-16]